MLGLLGISVSGFITYFSLKNYGEKVYEINTFVRDYVFVPEFYLMRLIAYFLFVLAYLSLRKYSRMVDEIFAVFVFFAIADALNDFLILIVAMFS
ncbi:MAG: hypothetical protein ACP5IZ_10005 [Thermoprotei archaeon]